MRSGYQANKAFTRLAAPASREEEEVVRRRRRKSWLQIQLIVINETKKKKFTRRGENLRRRGKPDKEVAIISAVCIKGCSRSATGLSNPESIRKISLCTSL